MGYGTRLLSRDEWGAQPPVCISHNIDPEGITVHYGGPSPWTGPGIDRSSPTRFRDTAPHTRCTSIARAYQAYHLDTQGWCDLAYSAWVCPHGVRGEGRGPGVRTGAQGTNDGNQHSYASVYLAGNGDPLTVEAKQAFLDEADRFHSPLRWGHRDWKSTSCPGDPTYAWRLAGFPRPPAAGPTAPIVEETDMLIVTNPRGQSLLVLGNAGTMGFSSSADRDAIAQKVDQVRVSEEQFDRFERLPRLA